MLPCASVFQSWCLFHVTYSVGMFVSLCILLVVMELSCACVTDR